MKIKTLFFITLFLAGVSCSKEEPLGLGFVDDPILDSWGGGSHESRLQTPKGSVPVKQVDIKDLPAWLQAMTQNITHGYIMKAGGTEGLYFVYDYTEKYGRYYDPEGKPSRDNAALTDWVVIYLWFPPYTT